MLFSDGIHNTAGDPVAPARKLGVVVHAIGVGNSLRNSPSYRDARVADLECPEQLPVNNRARITAHVGQAGLGGQVVKAILEEDGKPLDQAEIVLRDGDTPQQVAFQFVPTVKGRRTYTVRIPPVPEEKIAQNNHRSAVVLVVDSKIRVLYLEGTLRAEYGAIAQRFLSRDPDLEFCALVQTRPNVFVQRTNMGGLKLPGIPADAATLEKFDVILLGDLDSSYWKPQPMELLVQRVRAGAGLLAFGGYHSLGPGGYGGTALEGILPVLTGDRNLGQITDPFLPILTPSGRDHPIFANIGKFFPTSSSPPQALGLPPLDGCVRVKGARPGALVLQYASYLTAVLAYLMMRQQDAVGMTTFDTEVRLDLPARSSPCHFDEMMSHLEAIKPGRTTSLGATLHRLADRFKRPCLIILVSDLYDDPETVEPALHHFHYKRHEVIVFHVLDHAEITFPFRDTASFVDMETGERLQVDPAYVRDEYRRQLDAFIDRYRKICADCQFDYVLTDTSVPFDSMLSRYLEKRTRP